MNPLHLSTLGKNDSFRGILAFRPTPRSSARFRKNLASRNTSRSNFLLKFPVWSTRATSNRAGKLLISATFRRVSQRRNFLREKLIEEGKVRNDPNFYILDSNLDNQNSVPAENKEPEFFPEHTGEDIKNVKAEKSELLGESALLSRLEDWVQQYKKDSENWGVGSGPIFTIFEDLERNVSRVSVDEAEIVRRHEVRGEFPDVNLKIARAKLIASEAETGKYEFPRTSSIAKFVVEGTQSLAVDQPHSVPTQSDLLPRLSRIGFAMLCGCLVFGALKQLFASQNVGKELTRLEKEMLRRKMKSRTERGSTGGGDVEVLANDLSQESQAEPIERPQLDKHKLMKSIFETKGSSGNVTIQDYGDIPTKDTNFNDKILEIREMARQAREVEQRNPSQVISNENKNSKAVEVEIDVHDSNAGKTADMLLEKSNVDAGSENLSNLNGKVDGDLLVEMTDTKVVGERGTNFPRSLLDRTSADDYMRDGSGFFNETSANAEDGYSSTKNGTLGRNAVRNDIEVLTDPSERETDSINVSNTAEETPSCDSSNQIVSPSSKRKQRIILSVEEAREYLSQTHGTHGDKEQTDIEAQVNGHFISPCAHSTLKEEEPKQKVIEAISEETQILSPSNDEEPNGKAGPVDGEILEPYEGWNAAPLHTSMENRHIADNLSGSRKSSSQNNSVLDNLADVEPLKSEQNWTEKIFQEFEPIIKKMAVGFQENYIAGKEKAQGLMENGNVTQLGSLKDGEDLGWMEDDNLREIVFKVRENELAGRDPFHLMDAEDKQLFFKGLERKVERENEKLAVLHEWIHSKVENLDYGADGISLDDPPEKIIPRWKGPPPSEDPEFLNNVIGQQNSPFSENLRMFHHKNGDAMDGLQESKEQSSDTPHTAYGITNLRKLSANGGSTNPRTVIEGSDGSIRAGKKSGKEQWEHTKKWSREFLEVYNSEADPEMKSVLKDMGKDLDRWVTKKELQEAAELMDRIPRRRRKYIEKKVNKLKREVEMFGSQAVVSKYREYSEGKEPDYLWWLDLPFVLCIELYTNEDNVQRVGFYSLEMAADLELDPKQYHVIAFEDPEDCKNLCYIIQAHMDLLGNGNAFVVARPPKDAFREAKANGFNITVIRKGQLQLNVDQTLDEVEDEIIEIGSKMYQDKIMKERGISIDGLMKGVFREGRSRTTGGSSRKRIKKPATS